MAEKRKDNKGRNLRTGESQRKDGRYMYRWTVEGKEKTVYALSLEDQMEDTVIVGRRTGNSRKYAL